MNKIYALPDTEFVALVASSNSYTTILSQLGLTTMGGTSSKLLKKRIAELSCSIDHFAAQTAKASDAATRHTLEDVLIEKSPYTNMNRLKIRILKEGLMEYICRECGIGDMWNGKPLALQLDHINGVNDDHRLSNLRFLCPNCHSQTHSYAGRNKKKPA